MPTDQACQHTTDFICPMCNGRGQTEAHVCGRLASDGGFSERRILRCHQCDGTGRLSAEAMRRYTDGRAMAEDRKARGMTLRAEAARLGISPSELSDREWGRA